MKKLIILCLGILLFIGLAAQTYEERMETLAEYYLNNELTLDEMLDEFDDLILEIKITGKSFDREIEEMRAYLDKRKTFKEFILSKKDISKVKQVPVQHIISVEEWIRLRLEYQEECYNDSLFIKHQKYWVFIPCEGTPFIETKECWAHWPTSFEGFTEFLIKKYPGEYNE